jgi:hypothetical protein
VIPFSRALKRSVGVAPTETSSSAMPDVAARVRWPMGPVRGL